MTDHASSTELPAYAPTQNRRHTARRLAQEIFDRKPDWITFFREVLGVNGLVRQLFKTSEELAAFELTDAYQDIQEMLAKLRAHPPADDKEKRRVVTIRMPATLHEALLAEANDRKTSLNQLCITKLLQPVMAGEAAA